MTVKLLTSVFLAFAMVSCNLNPKSQHTETYPDIKIVGAMKNVMWKGKLGSSINLDTISETYGLYGVGPMSYLRGEIIINDGECYISKVTSDSTMVVEKKWDVSAPFFVYGNVKKWKVFNLPSQIKTIKDLEKFIVEQTINYKKPFVFKLTGRVTNAIIHIQNLPEGTKVSSPKEAHQGQVNYNILDEDSEIVGFFSMEHKGIFTHHDSYLHMHLITKDNKKMGHLDKLEIGNMKLYLPK